MNSDFKIIIITAPDEVPDEAARLTRLLDAGLDRLHIRKPGWPESRIRDLVISLPEAYRPKLTIHHHPDLSIELGCGVHISTEGRIFNENACQSAEGVLSRSCHSISQLTPDADYCFLSPIFDSISKTGYRSSVNLSELDLKKKPSKVIALGGVTPDKFDALKEAGFAGAALLGHVWNTPCGYEATLRHLRLRNFRLQFITDSPTPEGTATQARQALEGGCRWIQIRMKDSPIEEIQEAIMKVSALRPRFGGFTLIVDDHAELLSMPEVDGIHLGQQDMPPMEARSLASPDKIIGLTVNNPSQLLGGEYGGVDYYGIGPYHFTSTKKRLAPTLGLDGYRAINAARAAVGDTRPYVAIGGITAADLPTLLEAGVPGVAVSGAVSHAFDPVAAMHSFARAYPTGGPHFQ